MCKNFQKVPLNGPEVGFTLTRPFHFYLHPGLNFSEKLGLIQPFLAFFFERNADGRDGPLPEIHQVLKKIRGHL